MRNIPLHFKTTTSTRDTPQNSYKASVTCSSSGLDGWTAVCCEWASTTLKKFKTEQSVVAGDKTTD